MTRCLVLDALLVVSQCLLETEEQLGEFHLTCRAVRYTLHLACYLGATALAVLGNNIGWWISHNVRVSFDLLATGSLAPRGTVLQAEEAWNQLSAFLPDMVTQVMFWPEADTCFWVFSREVTAEQEVLCEVRFPGGYAALLLIHMASLHEDDDDDADNGDDVRSHSTHSVFGSDAPSLDGSELETWLEVVTDKYQPVGAEEVD